MKFGLESSSAPNSLDEDRFEGEGTIDFGFWISDCGFQIRRFRRAVSLDPENIRGRHTDALLANETICQILVAITDLAWRDLRRFNQRHVFPAHIPLHRSVLALVETGHVAEYNLDNSRNRS